MSKDFDSPFLSKRFLTHFIVLSLVTVLQVTCYFAHDSNRTLQYEALQPSLRQLQPLNEKLNMHFQQLAVLSQKYAAGTSTQLNLQKELLYFRENLEVLKLLVHKILNDDYGRLTHGEVPNSLAPRHMYASATERAGVFSAIYNISQQQN